MLEATKRKLDLFPAAVQANISLTRISSVLLTLLT